MPKNGQITVRGISSELMARLRAEASEEGRSLDKQAQHILAAHAANPSAVRQYAAQQSDRLNALLSAIKETGQFSDWTPSKIAEKAGELDAIATVAAFAGEKPLSWSLADRIAGVFAASADWLKHGTGQAYSPRYWHWNGETGEVAAQLTAGAGLSRLSFLRDDSQEGSLYVLRQFQGTPYIEWFSTPYHLSEEIGAGGEGDLQGVFRVLKALHENSTGCAIQSYIVSSSDVMRLLRSEELVIHPARLIKQGNKSSWWADIWDERMIERNEYWPGQRQFSKRILRAMEYGVTDKAEQVG